MARTREIIPLRFNEAQMRLYTKYQDMRRKRIPVRIIICKSRRAGLSTGVEALIYDDTTTHAGTDSLIVANEKNPSENVLGMCVRFWENTPEKIRIGGTEIQLRPKIPPQFNNNPSKDRLIFDRPLSSRIFVATARSIDAYLGYGFQNLHATEASRYNDAEELFRALYPTLSDDPHSAMYIESTPNGQEGHGAWFHEQVMLANSRKKSAHGVIELVFVPWWEMKYSFSIPFASDSKREAFVRSYTPAEKDVLKQLGQHVSPEQMQWRRMMLNGPTFNANEEIFDQEYPSDLATAFLLTGNSAFGRKAIKRLMANTREPRWVGDIYYGKGGEKDKYGPIYHRVRQPHFLTKGQAQAERFDPHDNDGSYNNLKVWRWPRPGERLFVGADIGGGNPETKNGDYSTFNVGVLNEFEQHELIMSWRARLNPVHFGEVLSALFWGLRALVKESAMMPIVAPEWTGPGTATVTHMQHYKLCPGLYYYHTFGMKDMPKTKHQGWESNAKTKPIAMKYTSQMITKNMIDVPDRELVLQMSSYREKDNMGDEKSYGGAPGVHDDLVSSFSIMCALIRLGELAVPGDADVTEVDAMQEDPTSPVWDPFADRLPAEGLPGLTQADVDAESLEQALFYGGW